MPYILTSQERHRQTPSITGVTAQQRYTWNGKVDISYTVTGDIAAEAKQKALLTSLKVTATDRTANTTYTATQLSGDMALTAGTHSIVWDMDAEGLTFKSTNVTAAIEMVNGVPQITWSPNLNTNGIERTYTIWGKTNLTDGVEWECPTNSAHRFFKVRVEMP